MISCLMVSKLRLTDEMRNLLYRVAFDMFQKKETEKKVRGTGYEGKVVCEYKYGMIGNVRGTVFSATIETDRGTGTVKYIVDHRDLKTNEDWVWIEVPFHGPMPTPEYMQ